MFKLSEEKDLKITALEASIQVTRESLEGNNFEKELKMTFDFAKNEAPKFIFKCSVCDKQDKYSNGLRMHINRKHTKYDENVTSFQCQNCGKEFRNAGEFKEHIYDVHINN